MIITLRLAIQNYRAVRERLKDGPYPHVSCQCAFCDVVRAADLMYEVAERQTRVRRAPRELLDDDRPPR